MEKQALLRALPAIDTLIHHTEIAPFSQHISQHLITTIARNGVDKWRADILAGVCSATTEKGLLKAVVADVSHQLTNLLAPSLNRVINATGVILHTGLGRARFSPAAKSQVLDILEGYCNLEFDLATGERGERTLHVEHLLCLMTGAEAAAIVNNNAAAVLLALNSLAEKHEVIISRGELIEIGGSFRIPDVMAKSGAIMVEVGTTNKTHPHDFENAVTDHTAGILHVHTSNYRVQGFTASVGLAQAVQIAKKHGLFLLHDLGGGILTDFRKFGLPYEPVVAESINAGADVVTFSGDKVLGGPQCGILLGKKSVISRIRKNPLMRALRCDKMTYALLESTLKLFLNEEKLTETHSVLRAFTTPVESIIKRAERVIDAVKNHLDDVMFSIEKVDAQPGSGTLPLEKLPSVAVVITSKNSISSLSQKLRMHIPAVVGYIKENALYLDMRTVDDDEIDLLINALSKI